MAGNLQFWSIRIHFSCFWKHDPIYLRESYLPNPRLLHLGGMATLTKPRWAFGPRLVSQSAIAPDQGDEFRSGYRVEVDPVTTRYIPLAGNFDKEGSSLGWGSYVRRMDAWKGSLLK